MKSIICYIYRKFQSCKNVCKWKSEIKKIYVNLDDKTSFDTEFCLASDKKILIVIPHPDDELIGCNSIIEENNENVVLFYSGLTGDDISEKNRNIRKNEFIHYCNEMKVQYVISEEYSRKEVENVISNHDFGYVFVPSVVDWHREHRKLFLDVVDLLVDNKNIDLYCYQVTVPIPQEYISHYSEMTKKQNIKKWKLFKKVYVSQNFMPLKRFIACEKIYRKFNKNTIAEVFMKVEKQSYDFITKEDQKNELDLLKKDINNLVKIRSEAELEYRRIFNIVGKDENRG